MLEGWVQSGRAFDIVLACLLLEALLLTALWLRRGAPALAAFLPNLMAGAALVLALRLLHGGAPWYWLPLLLLGALLAHLFDLRQRWGGPRQGGPREGGPREGGPG